jgi:hypothetical protein
VDGRKGGRLGRDAPHRQAGGGERALVWYNALRSLESFAETLGEPADAFAERAEQVEAHFDRFWDTERGYLRDVIDGPDGDDPSLRPNQIFAVSLPHSPLSDAQQQALVDTCAAHLYTPHGLRSLSPEHPDYVGVYQGGREDWDGAYHQGTVWSWLMGPFVKAHLRVHGDPATARSYLVPLRRHLDAHDVGSVSEIFDGDAPFTPQGTPAQAWGVAQVLAGYLGVTWTLFELMQWLTERYLISPYLGRALLLGLLLLLPSVLVVAYRHGRPGPDRWTSTERWTLVGNGAAAVLVLFVVFGDVELGSVVRTVQTSAADTSGEIRPERGSGRSRKSNFDGTSLCSILTRQRAPAPIRPCAGLPPRRSVPISSKIRSSTSLPPRDTGTSFGGGDTMRAWASRWG